MIFAAGLECKAPNNAVAFGNQARIHLQVVREDAFVQHSDVTRRGEFVQRRQSGSRGDLAQQGSSGVGIRGY